MESRVERNKRNRKKKRIFSFFILFTIILLILSIYQINNAFQELVGESSHLLALQSNEESIGVTVLGKDIKISKSSIEQGIKFFRETPKKISGGILRILQKVSND